MRAPPTPDDPGALLSPIERAAENAEPRRLVALLGELERLKAALWQRLLVAVTVDASPPASDPVDELRHLTPQQVGELLNLKPAYVHELCRTGRIAATKTGKYWMIPLADLCRSLYQNRGIDPAVEARLQSMNPRRDSAPRSDTAVARRSRGVRNI